MDRYLAGELDDMLVRIDVPSKKQGGDNPITIAFNADTAQFKDIDDALMNLLSGKLGSALVDVCSVLRDCNDNDI
jgi:hypothetical protein